MQNATDLLYYIILRTRVLNDNDDHGHDALYNTTPVRNNIVRHGKKLKQTTTDEKRIHTDDCWTITESRNTAAIRLWYHTAAAHGPFLSQFGWGKTTVTSICVRLALCRSDYEPLSLRGI